MDGAAVLCIVVRARLVSQAALVGSNVSFNLKAVTAIAGAFLTIGGAYVMFDEEFTPWAKRSELEEVRSRSCNNAITLLRLDLFRAQQNEFEANQIGNDEVALQAKQAQRLYEDEISEEKRKCGL